MIINVTKKKSPDLRLRADHDSALFFPYPHSVIKYLIKSFNPRPAGAFDRPRPAGGGGDSAPCPTPERMVIERRGKRQTKALNKTNLRNTKILASEIRSVSGQRSKLQVFTLLTSEPNGRSANRRYSPRTHPEVSKTRCRT